MVQIMCYTTIAHVIETWEELRRIKNYEEVAGIFLFQRLFEVCPQTKVLFGFPLSLDPHSDELLQSKRFLAHAKYMIQMLDTAIHLLGPDIELLTEIMLELGAKHVRYGVRAEMFTVMGECLIATLKYTLPHGLTAVEEEAWKSTYALLSDGMILAQK